jgi:hypothetical protein
MAYESIEGLPGNKSNILSQVDNGSKYSILKYNQ